MSLWKLTKVTDSIRTYYIMEKANANHFWILWRKMVSRLAFAFSFSSCIPELKHSVYSKCSHIYIFSDNALLKMCIISNIYVGRDIYPMGL